MIGRVSHGHGHSHGLVDRSIARSHAGLFVVATIFVSACLGVEIADPLIGLAITAVILRITWQSRRTVRGGHA